MQTGSILTKVSGRKIPDAEPTEGSTMDGIEFNHPISPITKQSPHALDWLRSPNTQAYFSSLHMRRAELIKSATQAAVAYGTTNNHMAVIAALVRVAELNKQIEEYEISSGITK